MENLFNNGPVPFKVGDVVQLNSGGPAMTIAYIKGDNIYCQWYNDENDRMSQHEFKQPMLKAYS